MHWILLAGAIGAEIAATVSLRQLADALRIVPLLVVIAGYAGAFTMLGFALRTVNVGAAYAIWSGVGTAGTAIIAALLFQERLTPLAIVALTLIIAGVVILPLSGASTH